MNYEKKYKEALERAKEFATPNIVESLEYIFPELSERNKERMRKFLCDTFRREYLSENKLSTWHGEQVVNILAWLEKQGEKNHTDISIKEKAHQIAWEISKHYDPNACKQEWCEMAALDMASWLEKQGEKSDYNPYKATIESIAAMVEKYANGDLKDFYDNIKVKYKDAIEYDNTWNEKQDDYNRLVEEIKERKELISKEKEKATSINDKLSLGGRVAILKELLAFTKEKQGEQKPTDFYCKDNCKGFQETGKCFADGECKAKKEAEQKPVWNDEDEYQINTILYGLELKRENYKNKGNKVEEERYNAQYSWLKSLKERIKGE